MQDCLDKLRLWQLWEQAVTGMKPSLQVLQHLLLPSFISNVTGPVKPKAFQDLTFCLNLDAASLGNTDQP